VDGQGAICPFLGGVCHNTVITVNESCHTHVCHNTVITVNESCHTHVCHSSLPTTHSYVWHASSTSVTWLICVCVTWLITTHSYARSDTSFLFATWLIRICAMTHLYHTISVCVREKGITPSLSVCERILRILSCTTHQKQKKSNQNTSCGTGWQRDIGCL